MSTLVNDFDRVQQVTVGDGLGLAYRSAGRGPRTILMLHGWPLASYTWRGVVGSLSEDYRIIAPDLAGFGASDKPADAPYDFAFHERVIEQLLDELGVGPAAVVGHDIGGALAVHWGLRRPGRVHALALLNTVLFPDLFGPEVLTFVATCESPRASRELTSAAGIGTMLRLGVNDDAAMPQELVDLYTAPFDGDTERAVLARAGSGLGRDGFEVVAQHVSELAVPVCGVYGEDDRLLGDQDATFARLRREVAGTEVTPIPGAGHFVQEEQPERVGALLEQFFGRVWGPSR